MSNRLSRILCNISVSVIFVLLTTEDTEDTEEEYFVILDFQFK
jgi:hypothetical protein